MPFTDVINNYTNGASGTLTDVNGDSVGYTVSGNSTNVNWHDLDLGARVNANQTQTFTVTFDDRVIGAAMQISGSDSNEIYYVEVDGVTVNLQTLIDDGSVTYTLSGAATHTIGSDGSIAGGHHTDGSIAELVFNIPVTSLGAYGTNGNSGNWDYFEVGIDSTLFNVVCFAQGTMIRTVDGDRPIETLNPGDRVETLTHGPQEVTWIGVRHVAPVELNAVPKLRPIRIAAGSLGQGLPVRDLFVSRQHRMVISSKIANRMFGTKEVMVPACKLTQLPGIATDEAAQEVTYFHLLLKHHEAIFAEGAPSESLFAGYGARTMLSPAAIDEIVTIFPEFAEPGFVPQSALPIPPGRQQKQLIARHLKNDQAVLQTHLHN
ncbi:MAG: Hint domain-containing protein [Pseudomonadota bacterium]